MQSILRWSLEHSDPSDAQNSTAERKPIDPGIIDMILGKPDAEQMKEDIAVAVDVSKSEDERIAAVDHLEMLVENIDNANDLEKLKIWEPLQQLSTADSSTQEIKTQALWIIGTALQNNPSAQDVYLSYHPLQTLLSFLDPSTASGASARSKAIYALSGLLKHNGPAVDALGEPDVDGWTRLRESLQDPSISVRRKVIFLLATLLTPTSPSPPSSPSSSQAPLLLQDDPNRGTTAIGPTESQSVGPALHGVGPSQPTDPVYPNSHAAHLLNPSRTSTSKATVAAFQKHGLIDAVISALTDPVPYGEDGDNTEADLDFEEKTIRLLHIYTVVCNVPLSKSQKERVRRWIQAETRKSSQAEVVERWSITKPEYALLIGKLL